ncbi:hypothetical protein DM813_19240 [Pseudomonas alkylphenolica]|uniref:DUF1833 domain-containing protein n=1 Tax=Pseudomonas alkylphenolica TaxID=237609 RepID=A0A443ZQF9_9PSED|nr:DUF1833 family protein [Pseudomonas alkylphenolica]RWU21322.1 hypothetical protein DM813_19240 [Pseudomonas alkylphenolica]
MTILEDTYREAIASGGKEAFVRTLEITCPSWSEPVLICNGFKDRICGTEDGRLLTFTAANIGIALPQKNNKGNQALAFAVDNTTGEVQQKADLALDGNARVTAVYRVFLASDTSAPCEKPYRMSVSSDSFEQNLGTLQCGFFDLIGTGWPRALYTTNFTPGLKYL